MRSRARALILAVLLCVPVAAFGQAGAPARRITAGATLPATCISSVVIRDIFYKSGSNAGIYVCTAANTWTLQSGLADVVGPASSTENGIVTFADTTGKLLATNSVTIDSGSINDLINGNVAVGLMSLTAVNDNGIAFPTAGVAFRNSTVGASLTLSLSSLTTNRIATWPDAAGTVAYTSSTVAAANALAANPADCAAKEFATTIAANGDLTCAPPLTDGSCTLDGGATATCTAAVPSGCRPICTYNSASVANVVACSVTDTTLTAVSGTTLDTGTVNFHCY